MTDIGAVVVKEWRELLGQRGARGKLGVVLFVAVFGVVMPLQNGPAWVTSPARSLVWAWVPMFLVVNVIADAFAGERERHTLETLLASRLPDAAMLLGKMAAAIGYAGAVTTVSLLAGLVTVNLVHAGSGLLLYRLPVVLAMAVLGFLGALLVAAMGVLISLGAATVRQAQQTLSGAIMVLTLGPVILLRTMPAAWKAALAASVTGAAELALLGVAALLLLDAGMVGLALRRFRRARLVVA